MRLRYALVITTALPFIFTSIADADAMGFRKKQESWPAWYVGLHGGVTYVHETDVEVGNTSAGDASFSVGNVFGGSLGYQYSKTFRMELEYSHRDNGLDKFDTAAGSTNLAGDLQADVYMANIFFDGYDKNSKWTPYFGLGAGVASVAFDSTSAGITLDDTDNVFAYQVLVGTTYAPSSMPHTEWGFGYRFLGTAAPEFANAAGQTVEHDYYSHGLEVNAKFRF